ncbi:MAG: ScyD/ScyE family protein [Candidatus Binatus sp.]
MKLEATLQYRCANTKATGKRQISVMASRSFCTEDAAYKRAATAKEDEMNSRQRQLRIKVSFVLVLAALITAGSIRPANCAPPNFGSPSVSVLASGLQGTLGSTVGPDGALYVVEGTLGQIARVDPRTGKISTFASGLPQTLSSVGIGGPTDVAFIGRTAYVLVTLVSSDLGGNSIDGIYRMDGPNHFTVIADIGQFNLNNPPTIPFPFFVDTGVLYAMQPYRGGFLVTDGHLNRVLSVTLGGKISVVEAFDDIVPTGLTVVLGDIVFMAEAGPVPHLPQDGKIVAFRPNSANVAEVASGASLLVDVKFGLDGRLYALSQGPGVPGAAPGSPAQPNSGALVRANLDGTFTFLVDNINLPTSLNFIGNTAYIVTLTGDVLKVNDVFNFF